MPAYGKPFCLHLISEQIPIVVIANFDFLLLIMMSFHDLPPPPYNSDDRSYYLHHLLQICKIRLDHDTQILPRKLVP